MLRIFALAVIVVIAGLTWFWMTLAPMVNLIGFAVALIIGFVVIASQVNNLSNAKARARKILPEIRHVSIDRESR